MFLRKGDIKHISIDCQRKTLIQTDCILQVLRKCKCNSDSVDSRNTQDISLIREIQLIIEKDKTATIKRKDNFRCQRQGLRFNNIEWIKNLAC